jgi:hypothetical protein
MAKGKPRWERVSLTDLIKKGVTETATDEELAAREMMREAFRRGERPEVHKTADGFRIRPAGRFVARNGNVI